MDTNKALNKKFLKGNSMRAKAYPAMEQNNTRIRVIATAMTALFKTQRGKRLNEVKTVLKLSKVNGIGHQIGGE
jgi:hypothetical protein